MFASRLLRTAFASSRRYASTQAIPKTRSRALPIVVATMASAGSLVFYNQMVSNEAQDAPAIVVDSTVPAFPYRFDHPGFATVYNLLGYGTRAVTFLNFRIYALGLYYAEQDLPLFATVLDSKFMSTFTNGEGSHEENVKKALQDGEKSRILIGSLLDSGMRMLARITPVRNTDFNHLREGLSKSILAHPDAKANRDTLKAGLEELKAAFIRKGSVPKGHFLFIELDSKCGLQLYYMDPSKDGEFEKLGHVTEPLVGKLLFSQYLSGNKPLSPSTRETSVEKIATLV